MTSLLLSFMLIGKTQIQKTKLQHFKIVVGDYKYGSFIDKLYTCDGDNISPKIRFLDIPQNTKSIALIMDDPDAPMGTWVHWVIFNIPPEDTLIKQGFPQKQLVGRICQGINDFREYGYGGPCPPSGVHRYFFKAYALDTVFECEKMVNKNRLLHLMKGHIIAADTFMLKYRRRRK